LSVLRVGQDGVCFYCRRLLKDSGPVDHFIPWARYPVDLAHNFVLAHGSCNESKSNLLASVEHLENWCTRNVDQERTLVDAFSSARLLHDLTASRAVTRWAYQLADQ